MSYITVTNQKRQCQKDKCYLPFFAFLVVRGSTDAIQGELFSLVYVWQGKLSEVWDYK